MARIKIEDLPVLEELTAEEAQQIFGGTDTGAEEVIEEGGDSGSTTNSFGTFFDFSLK